MSDTPFSADIEEIEPQPTVCARVVTQKEALGEVFSTVPAKVFQRLAEAGIPPAGALYARYPSFSDDEVDVEIGVPVLAPATDIPPVASLDRGEVGSGELPGGRVATTMHRGPYDRLTETYERLHQWIHDQGHTEGAGPWESYLDDPGDMSDMSGVRTQVVWPIA